MDLAECGDLALIVADEAGSGAKAVVGEVGHLTAQRSLAPAMSKILEHPA